MEKIRLRDLYCDYCNGRVIYIEKESVLGQGAILLTLGVLTCGIIIGIPFIIVGGIKLMRGYRYRMYCPKCGKSFYINKFKGEQIINGKRNW